MSDPLSVLSREINRALEDGGVAEAVGRYLANYTASIEEIERLFPETRRLAEEVAQVRDEVVANLEYYVDKAMRAVEANGGKAYLARDAAEARRILGDIVGSGKIVVLGKSLTGEEVGVYEHLTRLGNEVWETDLGELLVRLAGQRPMHMIAPALNMTRERAISILNEKLGLGIPQGAGVGEVVSAVRRFLRGKFERAEVGITGANMVASDTGSLILIENEGNIRLASSMPPVHVAVVGVEKVYPTLLDALKAAIVTIRYGGYKIARYVSVVSGPSATGDIEKIVVKGAHGPRELHVLFVDNGRLRAARDPVMREALKCLRCGACQLACPVYELVAGFWGGRVYAGGIGVAWTYITEGIRAAGPLSTACTLMGRCREACPVGIDIPRLVREARSRYASSLLQREPRGARY